MSASKGLLALLAGASMVVACGGVVVGHKAVSSAQRYMQDALTYKAQAEDLKGRLAVARGQLADAEKRIAEARKGLTKRERQILASSLAGKPGTIARALNNPCNIKQMSGGRKWRGEIGVDRHGHVRFSSIHYGLRAAAFVLHSYETKHKIKTIEGLIERFCGGNRDYVKFLSRRMGLKPDEEFSFTARMADLLRFMSIYESGAEVSPELIATMDVLASI